MKTLLGLLILTTGFIAWGQDQPKQFHVNAVHEWTVTDAPRVTKGFATYVVTGTIGNVKYTTQQIFSWGSQRFEIGTDYPVDKQDDRAVTVVTHNKKGREIKERLDITGAEEKQ